ncbi:hypothetical protein [Gracilibacillus massiliensis]|uniref:hypothetical protein n=1 Tax=Gracilibacillus massiliensis TaxID=1564956 RepID=UPI00071E44EA|nr:hypothetical protein [Gracilibacillus massiliensis]
MGKNHYLGKLFPPKKIKDVDYILEYYFEGIEISKEDNRIKFILDDPYAPEMELIKGVYVISKKAILELLEGRIHSIYSYEFNSPKKKTRTISDEDIEYVLEMATVVVLASENDQILTTFFIAGSGEKLNSILNLCRGYSKDLENNEFKVSLQNFINDIEVVKQMGLLQEIIVNE